MAMTTPVPPPATTLATTVRLPAGRYWIGDPGVLAVSLSEDDAADPDMRPRRFDAPALAGPGVFCRSARIGAWYFLKLGPEGADPMPLLVQPRGRHVAILPIAENDARWLSRLSGIGLTVYFPMGIDVSRTGPADAHVVVADATTGDVVCTLSAED